MTLASSPFFAVGGTNDFTKSKNPPTLSKVHSKIHLFHDFLLMKKKTSKSFKIPRFPSEPRTVSAPTRSRPKAEKVAYSARVSPDLGCSGCSPLKGLATEPTGTNGQRGIEKHQTTGISPGFQPQKIHGKYQISP